MIPPQSDDGVAAFLEDAEGARAQADERGHGESHGVVHQGGVDAAMQSSVAVKVDVLHVYVADGLPRLDFLDLTLDVPREGHFLVEVLREPGQLAFVQVSYGLFHHLLPTNRSARWRRRAPARSRKRPPRRRSTGWRRPRPRAIPRGPRGCSVRSG